MKVVTKDNAIFHFTAKNEPIAYVQQNEEFWVETHDCYFGQIRTEKDLRPDIDGSLRNAATGPIHVAGVLPGDVICVEILDIHLNSYGIMMPTRPWHSRDLVTGASEDNKYQDGLQYSQMK